MKRSLTNLIGQRFGRLVVKRGPFKDLSGRQGMTCWDTVCDCGAKWFAAHTHLMQGKVKSCGCLRREMGIVKLGKRRRKQEVSS